MLNYAKVLLLRESTQATKRNALIAKIKHAHGLEHEGKAFGDDLANTTYQILTKRSPKPLLEIDSVHHDLGIWD